jgi:2-amino-4-hydroxy-6-hydroxymethyldihydropteridine diphosphokinase
MFGNVRMIIIALGSNISGPWGTPHATLTRAVAALNQFPIRVKQVSSFLETKPHGNINQPNFVNAAATIETALSPEALIRRLHMIEHQAGRRRRQRWGPRTLDLDIIDYNGLIRKPKTLAPKRLQLPHPQISERSFVLQPVCEVAPNWKHPVTHQKALVMIQKLYRLNRA